MQHQKRLGLDIITSDEIERSRQVASGPVDLESIRRRELICRHDLKARLEEFADLSRHQHVHLGMTSADVVENVALMKMNYSLRHLAGNHDQPQLLRLARVLPFRGIKGPVGTQQDQLELLGSYEKCQELDRAVAEKFGFQVIVDSVSQVMFRSVDLRVVSTLVNACAGIRHPYQALLCGYLDMVVAYQGDTWNEGDVSSSVIRRVALPGAFFAASALLGL